MKKNDALTVDLHNGNRLWVVLEGFNKEMLVVNDSGKQKTIMKHEVKKLHKNWVLE